MSTIWQEQVKRDRDPALEEINRLALARIQWMQDEIARKYRLHLRMGTETETVMKDKDGNLFLGDRIY